MNMQDDLIICRCEEVTVEQIRTAIRQGAVTLAGIKRRTRAGMGLCQGRTCGALVTRILSVELSRPLDGFAPDAIRPPSVPVTFGVLAGDRK